MPKKAQSGRAKQKQKAQKKSPGGTGNGKVPLAKQFARGQLFDDDGPSGPMFRGFAQRSGQNTPQTSSTKLRHQGIAFVSASPAEQEKDTQMLDDEAIAAALAEQEDDQDDEDDYEDAIDDSALQTNILEDTDADIAHGTEAMHIHEPTKADSSTPYGLDEAADIDMAPAPVPAPLRADKPPTPPPNDEPLFVVDTVGDPALVSKFKGKSKVPVRAASPTPSDSSGDEIVFRGRNATVIDDPYSKPKSASQQPQAKLPASKSPPKPAFLPPHKKREAHVTDDLLAALGVSTESSPVRAPIATGWAGKAPHFDSQIEDSSAGFTPAPEGSWWRKKGMPRPDLGPLPAEKKTLDQEAAHISRKNKVGFAEPEEELGAEETIATLQADWKNVKSEKKRASRTQREVEEGVEAAEQPKSVNRAIAHQLGVKTSRRGKRGRKRQNQLLRDLESEDSDEELAMARDYMENLKAQGEDIDIGGLRSADGGPSLVIDGNAIGEDELLDDSMRDIDPSRLEFGSGSSDSDSDVIGQDLDELEDDDEDDMDASDYDSSDLEIDLEYDEREQWEDEEDLRRRRIEAMDDEMIARLFHKQAELGIDGDELVIDDGAFVSGDIEGFGDLDEARAGLEDLSNISFGRSASKRPRRGGKKGGFSFPDASALADAVDQYGDNGFDIMDYDRPSLRPTKKGRKGKLPPELEALEDEELRDSLLGAWDNDRAKKSLKKQEREELRMQGLLGSAGKKGKVDLNAKYLQGMTLVQVHAELRIFMQDDDQEVKSFPPMAKDDRAALHAIASRLNLTSKSQGQGKKRFPMLYKTSRTPDYNEAQFRRILAASERGFLKNSSYKAKGGRGGASGGRGGRGGGRGGAAGGHGLRDGEEVGANAKEIGKENFGHRLMEKMGWTKGTALGKDGSGLLVPVAQVMKTGRGGLG